MVTYACIAATCTPRMPHVVLAFKQHCNEESAEIAAEEKQEAVMAMMNLMRSTIMMLHFSTTNFCRVFARPASDLYVFRPPQASGHPT